VHYDSAGMAGSLAKQAEEGQFLSDFRAFLGVKAAQALDQIGQRLNLDYCGIDFSLMPDGQILIFEANPTMFIHPEAPEGEFAYKNAATLAIAEAFQNHVAAKCDKGL